MREGLLLSRYAEFRPISEKTPKLTLLEGNTPLLPHFEPFLKSLELKLM